MRPCGSTSHSVGFSSIAPSHFFLAREIFKIRHDCLQSSVSPSLEKTEIVPCVLHMIVTQLILTERMKE